MKLGAIGDSDYLIVDGETQWNLRSFSISRDRLSFFEIFDSAFATPARYIEEIFLRLSSLEKKGARPTPTLVFNPLFDADQLTIIQVMVALRDMISFDGITVFTDKNGLPAAYLLPPEIGVKEARLLRLLSTVDGEIDTALCSLIFRTGARSVRLPWLAFSGTFTNGFAYKENRGIYKWTAERAIHLIRSEPATPAEDIPTTAILLHHAGDILFFVLAFMEADSHITRVAVNEVYRDIVDDNAPGLAVLSITGPVNNRSDEFRQGKVTSEAAYFEIIKDQFPADSFYSYFRLSRDYNPTSLHLIDHFAFAMGCSLDSDESLLSRRRRPSAKRTAALCAEKVVRILLHFDGGWGLKIYPHAHQERLIELLQAKGYVVTVLAADSNAHLKCDVTTFKSYSEFKALLQSHHLLVGMDSFPAHYGAHVQDVPTICLFATTRPENSNAPGALNYAYLEEGLRCRPCAGIVRCPLYGGDSCRNFVSPEKVALEVERMLAMASSGNKSEVQSLPRRSDEFARPAKLDERSKVRRITLDHMYLKIFRHAVIIRPFRYLLMLCREFSAVARKDGFAYAGMRALFFLRKRMRCRR